MRFRDLQLRRVYDTGDAASNVLVDFYIPVLRTAKSYDRLTGFFSSTSLAYAARGIAGLIKNEGKMRLVASPLLTRTDRAIVQSLDTWESSPGWEEAIIDALSLEDLANEIARDHVRALGWLLREERLKIRLIVPSEAKSPPNGLFHPKVGVLTDQSGDRISFSGSINETARGWLENIEEFKVFRSWVAAERDLVEHDSKTFERYWNLETSTVRSTDIPDAVRNHLVSMAPTDVDDLQLEKRTTQVFLGDSKKHRVPLREYQYEAVSAWFNHRCRGILEMATGTGKTRTAVECIHRLAREPGGQLVVITAPSAPIAVQWAQDLAEDNPVLAYGKTSWRAQLQDALANIKLGLRRNVTVVAVQNTAGSDDFLRLTSQIASAADRSLFVGDEVHALGAREMRRALAGHYTHRLGLSATPTRWFDEEGTRVLSEFFGEVVYVFGIREALSWIDPKTGQTPLCPYEYYPVFVHLDDTELEEYLRLTNKIGRYMGSENKHEKQEYLEKLLFRRAGITKEAGEKISALERILDKVGTPKNALIYCNSKSQMKKVTAILKRRGIKYNRFTGDEGTAPSFEYGGLSEREAIIRSLADGTIDALVAIKCLDEGIDIPSAQTGMILASSSNPREFIQRRGRLLRRAPGKELAIIYDVIVAPDSESLFDPVARKVEQEIFGRELERINEFADNARNGASVHAQVLRQLQYLNSR